MDASGGVFTAQSGNVVLKSRSGEAGKAPAFVLRAASRNGNRRQSRWSPSVAASEQVERSGVALRPSRRFGIFGAENRQSEWRLASRGLASRGENWRGSRTQQRHQESEPHRLVTIASRNHDTVLVQSDDCEAVPRRAGGGQRSFSYSYSRSPRGGRKDRSASPMSVGSSVIEEPKKASNTKRRVPGGQSTLQAGQARCKKKVRRRVAKHVAESQAPAPATKRSKMQKPGKTLQAKAASTVPIEQRVRKRRRTSNSGPVGKEASAPVVPPRRTAAKSAPAPPPTLTVPQNVMDVELNPVEQQELKDSVVKHVRQTVQADDEPDILAEFICVLLDQKKSSAEILEELSVMDDEAQPFVTWLEKEKAALLARRPSRTSYESRRPPPSRDLPKVLVDEAPDKPPGQFTPLPSRSQALLTPNAVTASLEESGKASSAGDRQGGLVVITNRLVLQPNCGHRPEGPFEVEKVSLAEKKVEEAHQKKLDLLAEMTKELQVILQRLSDKNLADASRERYQTMAQTIQNRMASLSRSEKAERVCSAQEPLWQEKPATTAPPATQSQIMATAPPATSPIVVSPASSA